MSKKKKTLGSFASQPAIRVGMMPKDTNYVGTIFGGVILSHIDMAGAVEAHMHAHGKVVTVAMDRIEFHAPVYVGDFISFFTETLKLGTTSITVKVRVEAERPGPSAGKVLVTEAEVVFVQVDERNRPKPLVARAESNS